MSIRNRIKTTFLSLILILSLSFSATAFAQGEAVGKNFNSSFNGSSAGWSAVTGVWKVTGYGYYRSNGIKDRMTSAKRAGNYSNFTYSVRMKRVGAFANGVIIRGNPNSLSFVKSWKSSYWFAYTNNGTFSIWKYPSRGAEVALKDWTASSAIVKNGWNTLTVTANGSNFKFYINGKLVAKVADPSFRTGQVGFGFYRDTPSGYLVVNWAKVSKIVKVKADANLFEEVAPGVELEGGNSMQSP
ncbi:MAG TPA: DUF1080 domain-containing protein [Anaerolineales bacterium]|nr:DUF1080 domain-containing protein [Anaerolineales bacterium]